MESKPFFLCVFTLLFSSYAASENLCGNFESGTLSTAAINSEFQAAVFRLQVERNDSSGTGYLIDTSNGYILTAAHVVQSAGPKAAINVTNPHYKGLIAKVLKIVPDADIALIQIVHPEKLAGIRSLDVTFRFPSNDTPLVSIGYPAFGDEPNEIPHTQPVSVIATSPNGSIEVKQTAALGGASGGPLIDATGSAVGTCQEQLGFSGTVARYAPMSLSRELLNIVPLSRRMQDLDKAVKSGSITPLALGNLMIKSSSNPSNLELYTWVTQIAAHRREYSSSAALLRCPIIPALMQRGLDDLVIDLTSYASSRDIATANFRIASRELAIGQNIAAITHSQIALSAYRKENLRSEALLAQLILTQAQLNTGAITSSASNLKSLLSRENIRLLSPEQRGELFDVAGMLSEKQGRFDLALQRYSKASELHEKNGYITKAGDSQKHVANIHFQKGETRKAREVLRRALELYSKDGNEVAQASALFRQVQFQYAVGEVEKANAELKTYLEMSPTGPHSDEAKALLKLHKYQGSRFPPLD